MPWASGAKCEWGPACHAPGTFTAWRTTAGGPGASGPQAPQVVPHPLASRGWYTPHPAPEPPAAQACWASHVHRAQGNIRNHTARARRPALLGTKPPLA